MRFAFHEYFFLSFKKYSPLTWVKYRKSSHGDLLSQLLNLNYQNLLLLFYEAVTSMVP
jgi:hypothetical protein